MGSNAQGNKALKLENDDTVIKANEVPSNLSKTLLRIGTKNGEDKFGNYGDYYLIERGGKGTYLGANIENFSFEKPS